MKKLNENTNIYRTNKFIVEQTISITNSENSSIVYSYDVYYLRNRHRDKKYNNLFASRNDINGKRVHATMYVRKYMK